VGVRDNGGTEEGGKRGTGLGGWGWEEERVRAADKIEGLS